MKHLRRNRALATLLSLALVAGLFSVTAFASEDGTTVDPGISQSEISAFSSVGNVQYLDENGKIQYADSATLVESDTTNWTAGWYVVKDNVTIDNRITVTGDVYLILENRCNLQAPKGIEVNSEGASLTIYAQSLHADTMGALTATGVANGDSGIGGDIDSFQGAITINGGKVNATGENGSAGIGGISQIGDENSSSTGTVTINGGIVTATGGQYAPGIGIGGKNGSNIIITINGGTITATGGPSGGAGIGSRENSQDCNFDITITGGTVQATGTDGGAGIGGGAWGNNGKITITGGIITATGSSNGSGVYAGDGAGIGGGRYTEGYLDRNEGIDISISGGVITATGGGNAPGIGAGVDQNGDGGAVGSFEADGNAVIFASSILDTSDKEQWTGIIFQGTEGEVYGSSVTLDTSFAIPNGHTLTVPGDATLTLGDGVTITNHGAIENCGVINGTGKITEISATDQIALDILDENGQDTDGKIAYGQEITLRAYGPNLPTSGNVKFSWDGKSESATIENGEAEISIQIPEGAESGFWSCGEKTFTVTADGLQISGAVKADLRYLATPTLTLQTVTTSTVTVVADDTVLGNAPEETPTILYGYSLADEPMKDIVWKKQGPAFSGLNPGTAYKFYAKVQGDENFHEMISAPLEVSTQPARADFSAGDLDLAAGKVSIRSIGNGKLQVVQAGEFYEISEDTIIPITGTWSQPEDSGERDAPISVESGVNAQICLSDVTMTTSRYSMSGAAVSVDKNSTVRLILEGNNCMSGFMNSAIELSDSCSLILDGTGSLTIGSSDNYPDEAIYLPSNSTLQIEGGRLIAYVMTSRFAVEGRTAVTLPISKATVQAVTLSDENGALDSGWAMVVPQMDENSTLWLADGTYSGSILVNGEIKTIPEFTVPAQSGSTVQIDNSDISVTLPDDAKLPLPVVNGQFVVPGGTTVTTNGEKNEITEDSALNPADGQIRRCLTVTFDAQNGTTLETYDVIEGDTVTKPTENPEKPGYVFAGWHREQDAESPFDFESAIAENTTLYAHWIQIQDVNLTITATPSALSGGGTVTLTVSGLPDGERATVTCPDAEVTGNGVIFTATLPNLTKTYTFTANYAGSALYNPASATCTVAVTQQNSSGGGGTSSGGGSSSGSQSETITNPDGSTTTIVTNSNGDRIETTQYPDGSSSVTTVDADGNTKIEVKLPEKVLADAAENKETVKLPISAVETGTDNAAAITVDLPENTVAKVEIPVANVTAGTVAVVVKPDGTEEVLMNSTLSENGVVATVSDGMVVKVEDRSKNFTDLPAGHWSYDDVQFTVSHNLFHGTSNDMFSPDLSMTRAMVVTVLARYEGVNTSAGSTWYEAGREWAMQNGVSDGTNIEDSITREQLAAMLYRYAGEPAVSGTITGFTDAAAVSDWAQDAMLWAIENGLISGMGDGLLNPKGNATRAQVATILARFVKWTA